MSRYVDLNVWSGTWPFGGGETFALAEVIADLQRVGVREAWVSPLGAVLAAHPAMANARLIEEMQDLLRSRSASGPTRGRPLHTNGSGDERSLDTPCAMVDIMAVPIIDPSLADWPDQLAAAAQGAGDRLRAIRIVPNYHNYALDHPAVDALAEALTDQTLPLIVQVRMLDERAHHPRMVIPPVPVEEIAALGRRHPALRIIASGIFFGELAGISDVPNVCVELSSIETGETLPDLLAVVTPERIFLGTHAPLYVPAAAVAKLDGEGIAPETLAEIGAEHARTLYRKSAHWTSPMEGSIS